MKNQMLFLAVLILVLAFLTGCQAPASPAASTPLPDDEPAAPTIAVLQPGIQPLMEEVCNGQAQAVAHFLNVFEVVQSVAQLDDYASGVSGTGCLATVVGDGAKFPSPDAVVSTLGGMLAEQGWTEDMNLQAGGPTGMAAGYRKGGEICLVSAMWEPAASANCPKDQPIMLCSLAPEQKLYTVTLNCGEEILLEPGGQTPGMENPASASCIAQGGMLLIEERGDGGQYGVCLFEDNRQCEEWALYNGFCPAGGLKITGYTTPAAVFCAITGGTYTATSSLANENEQGSCKLPGGKVCDVWEYYSGACSAD
jgi:putative hemolysin